MAVVVAPEDADKFIEYAQSENLEAYRVAVVTEEARMVMSWKGQTIADLSREFLNTNGADKHTEVEVTEKDLSAFSKPLYTDLRHLLISWLQSPSAVILEPKNIKSDTVSTVSPSISSHSSKVMLKIL